MTIDAALKRSEELSTWLDKQVDGLEIASTDRGRMSAACLDQVHEHHKAIQLLVRDGLVGSAFSLVRPIFETFIRGLWLCHCASDKEVESFAKDRIDKKLDDLISEVESRDGYKVGILSKVKKSYWTAMCSYVHGGYLQAVRRITPAQIRPNYSEREMLEVIKSADAFAMLAASEIFSIAKREDLVAAVLERMRGASLA